MQTVMITPLGYKVSKVMKVHIDKLCVIGLCGRFVCGADG